MSKKLEKCQGLESIYPWRRFGDWNLGRNGGKCSRFFGTIKRDQQRELVVWITVRSKVIVTQVAVIKALRHCQVSLQKIDGQLFCEN